MMEKVLKMNWKNLRIFLKAKQLSQTKFRWLVGEIGSAETLVQSTKKSEGLRPRKAASPALYCPVLPCPVFFLSNTGRTCKWPAWLGLYQSTSNTDLSVFWDKMNVSVGLVEVLTSRSQEVSLSRLEPWSARKLLIGSIDVQYHSA